MYRTCQLNRRVYFQWLSDTHATMSAPTINAAFETPPAVTVRPAPRSKSSGPSLLTDQALVVDEGVAHEGRHGLVRGGGAAECRALHEDEHEGDGSGKDEGGLHVVASNFL